MALPAPPTRVPSTIRAPSVWGRAAVSLAFIAGFYVLTIGIVLVLLALPIGAGMTTHWRHIRALLFVTAICWVPAFLVTASLLGVRRSRHAPTGQRAGRGRQPEVVRRLQSVRTASC